MSNFGHDGTLKLFSIKFLESSTKYNFQAIQEGKGHFLYYLVRKHHTSPDRETLSIYLSITYCHISIYSQ